MIQTKSVLASLLKLGFQQVQETPMHIVLKRDDRTVVLPRDREVPQSVLNSILNQAGIDESQLTA